MRRPISHRKRVGFLKGKVSGHMAIQTVKELSSLVLHGQHLADPLNRSLINFGRTTSAALVPLYVYLFMGAGGNIGTVFDIPYVRLIIKATKPELDGHLSRSKTNVIVKPNTIHTGCLQAWRVESLKLISRNIFANSLNVRK